MKYQEKLIKGKFLKRYKRFFADVELENGDTAVAHCANSGSMLTLLDSQFAYITYVDDPKRKLKYTLQQLEKDGVKVNVNTQVPNKIAVEAIEDGTISELSGFTKLETEKKYGEQKSRIDILLHEENDKLHYVEVKSVSMAEDNVAMFPDAVTTRGQKHLEELKTMVNQGHKATMLYIIARNDCNVFKIAKHIDSKYFELLKEAVNAGVKVLAYECNMDENGIQVTKPIKFEMD